MPKTRAAAQLLTNSMSAPRNPAVAVSAEQLLAEALVIPFRGWDFSVLGDRLVVEPAPWSFELIVDDAAQRSASMLDMGTGGGEWLSHRCRAPVTIATESSIERCRRRKTFAAGRCRRGACAKAPSTTPRQHGTEPKGRLAFRDSAFDLVINRHESFVAAEIRRVLRY